GVLHRAALSACRLLAGLLRRGRRAPFHVLPGIAAWAIVLPGGVLVLPNEGVVRLVLDAVGVFHQFGEHAVQILGVAELRIDDGRGVGVVHHVVAEERIGVPPLAADYVVDQATQERDVAARADLHVHVAGGAR